MAREIELRRHTDSDGDVLTAEGVRAALDIGSRLTGGYDVAVSTGAQRATQTLACFLAALGEKLPGGVMVEPDLRSQIEDRWRAAYERAGSGSLEALRGADPELVAEDSAVLGAALGRVFEQLAEGGRALVVGHSPTNEAAVLGLTGQAVPPLAKGAGVLVIAEPAGFRVERLD
jgi:broad specificity phosphatase PhoE